MAENTAMGVNPLHHHGVDSVKEIKLLEDSIKGTLTRFKELNPNLRRVDMLHTLLRISVEYGIEYEKNQRYESWERTKKNDNGKGNR